MTLDVNAERRAAHERARQQNQIRVASVLGAHGALYSSLRTGVLRLNDHLDETRLVPMFSVSRNAIRGALRLLAEEGVVSRAPRNGTVVVATSNDVPLDSGVGWADDAHGGLTAVVTDQRWVVSTPMTRLFLETDSDRVHTTEVVDLRDGRPDLRYVRFSLADGAGRPLVARPEDGDFPTVFFRTYGSPLAAIDCWVEAAAADPRSAELLHVRPGTPLIVKSRVLRSADGRAREFSISYYPAAHVSLSADVHSAGTVAGQRRSAGRAPRPRRLPANARRLTAADLHTELRAALREGVFAVGDRLDEQDLAEVFGAGRSTVRDVLARLVAEGLVGRSRRDGTVVASAVADYTLNAGMPYRADERDLYRDERLNSVVIPTPPFVAGLLRTDAPSVVLDEYLMRRAERPMTVYIRYVEESGDSRPLTSTRGEDFSALFERAYGVAPGMIAHSLHAVRANEQVARRLNVRPGTILLLSERIIHDEHGRPRELSHSYHLATHISLASHHDLGVA